MKFKIKALKNQQGFLIAEVMILMLVLSLLLPAAAALFRSADKAVVMAERQNKASYLAQSEQELLKTTTALKALGERDERKVVLDDVEYTVIRQKKRMFPLGSVKRGDIWKVAIEVSWSEYLEETKVCRMKIIALHKQD